MQHFEFSLNMFTILIRKMISGWRLDPKGPWPCTHLGTKSEDANTFKCSCLVVLNRLRISRRFGRSTISSLMAMQSDTGTVNGLVECVVCMQTQRARTNVTYRVGEAHSAGMAENYEIAHPANITTKAMSQEKLRKF